MRALLNALPINAFKALGKVTVKIQYLGTLAAAGDEVDAFKRRAENFISHPATAALLGLPASKGFYQAERGDELYVLTLAKPVRNPQDMQNITPQDIDVYKVVVE